ncbi:universal stress protein [Candidatus Methanocrinis natronophilus]|uniref:Universal stress protein n=1 Tax=Candidatus Methanocrinis natronophilus TaxID=3033396 RepID=A0ABT5X5W0_9EURY|nr:universal stress protein [Candidatus Methanocrinis natronophilus]MDF0590086.1 universal stress protein [Candidatus Methanocrinis natronophilus]
MDMESVEDYGIKKIVVSIDTSEYSKMVMARASAIAIAFEAEIHVISVVSLPKLVASVADIGREDLRRSENEFQDHQKRLIDEYMRGYNLRVESRVLHGDPSAKILSYADEIGADLIVMGSKAYGKVQRFLLGGVSEEVVRNAKCSVMIAR